MDSPLDCAVTGETAVTERANRGEQVEGDGFSDIGGGDPACGPSNSPRLMAGEKILIDLSVIHFIMML